MRDPVDRDPWPAWRWSLLLFGAALLLRAAHLATLPDSPFLARLGLDSLFHEDWGKAIAAGSWLGTGIFYQDPAYAYFLGVVYALFGPHRLVAVAIQLALGALVAPLLFAASDRALGRGPAIAAGILAATYVPAIYYEGLILKTWMELLFTAAAFWTLSRAIASSGRAFWCAAGIFLGLDCLVRGNLLLPTAAVAAWVLLDRSASGRTGGPRLSWRPFAALVLGVLAVLGPVAVRNRAVGGEWVITTAQGGQNFYQGNNPLLETGRYRGLPFVRANPKHEEGDFVAEAERRAGREMTTRDASRFWFREAVLWIRSHPGAWLVLLARKVAALFEAYEVPDNYDYYYVRETAPVLRLPLPGYGLVAPLGLLGAILLWRRPGWVRGVLVHVAAYSASILLFFVISRYRMAMIPALVPFAGYAVVRVGGAARDAVRGEGRRRRAAIGILALLAALLAAVNLPVRVPETHWAATLAAALRIPARPEVSSIAHYNQGVLLAKEGSLEEAERELREALRQDTRHAQMYVELGKVLARQGRTREAIASYEGALAIEPRDPVIHHVLGILHRRAGEIDAARASFRRALEIDPRRKDSAREIEALERGAPGGGLDGEAREDGARR